MGAIFSLASVNYNPVCESTQHLAILQLNIDIARLRFFRD